MCCIQLLLHLCPPTAQIVQTAHARQLVHVYHSHGILEVRDRQLGISPLAHDIPKARCEFLLGIVYGSKKGTCCIFDSHCPVGERVEFVSAEAGAYVGLAHPRVPDQDDLDLEVFLGVRDQPSHYKSQLMFNQSLDIVSNPAHTSIAAVLLLAVWFLVYLLVCKWCPLLGLVKFKVDDTRNRIVSMIHGAISFCFACTQFLPFATFDLPNTFAQTSICLFSLSYCLYDLAACIYYKLDDLSLWLHHFFCINGFGFAVATGYGAIDGIGGLFVAEVSNLPMHLRMILRNYGLKYTRTYELVENIYLALYVCFRGLYCPFFLLYPCLMSSHTPILVKAMCFSLTVQSYYFIVQMWKIIQKKFQRSNEMKAIDVQLQWLSQDEQQLSKLSFYRKNDDKKIF